MVSPKYTLDTCPVHTATDLIVITDGHRVCVSPCSASEARRAGGKFYTAQIPGTQSRIGDGETVADAVCSALARLDNGERPVITTSIVTELHNTSGHFARLACKIDGVACDVHKDPRTREIVVTEVRHPSRETLRGAEVPAEIVAAWPAAEAAQASHAATADEIDASADLGPKFVGPVNLLARE